MGRKWRPLYSTDAHRNTASSVPENWATCAGRTRKMKMMQEGPRVLSHLHIIQNGTLDNDQNVPPGKSRCLVLLWFKGRKTSATSLEPHCLEKAAPCNAVVSQSMMYALIGS